MTERKTAALPTTSAIPLPQPDGTSRINTRAPTAPALLALQIISDGFYLKKLFRISDHELFFFHYQ